MKQNVDNSQEPNSVLYCAYGTLRHGFGNNRLLQNSHCKLLGTQKTTPEFKMVSLGGFPGLIPGGDQEVTIEVYSVDSKQVEQSLDRLEGYPNFYDKMEIDTNWGKANVYILSERKYGKLPIVKSGDWVEFVTDHVK